MAGFKAVDAIITGYLGQTWLDEDWRDKPCMTLEQAKHLRDAGWDIVSHSVTHPHFARPGSPIISESEALSELVNSRDFIRANNFEDRVFAWPFGEVAYEDLALRYYSYERKAQTPELWDGQNRVINLTMILDHRRDITSDTEYAINLARNGIAILLMHGIRTLDEPRDPWELTPEEFVSVVNQVVASGVEVKTFSECLSNRPSPLWLAITIGGVTALTLYFLLHER